MCGNGFASWLGEGCLSDCGKGSFVLMVRDLVTADFTFSPQWATPLVLLLFYKQMLLSAPSALHPGFLLQRINQPLLHGCSFSYHVVTLGVHYVIHCIFVML